jgi:hypothetical protein
MDFAIEKYGKAMDKSGPLHRARLAIEIMTDAAEVQDKVGPYGKSLLYLVSRALENMHKMPLLGLEVALQPDAVKKPGMELADGAAKLLEAWKAKVLATKRVDVTTHAGPKIRTSTTQRENIAHGSFDNAVDVVSASLLRMLGAASGSALPRRITDLTGF